MCFMRCVVHLEVRYVVHLEVHCNDYNLPIANAIYIVPVQVVGNN